MAIRSALEFPGFANTEPSEPAQTGGLRSALDYPGFKTQAPAQQETGGLGSVLKNIPTFIARSVTQPAEFAARTGTTIGSGLAKATQGTFIQKGIQKIGDALGFNKNVAEQAKTGIQGKGMTLPFQTEQLFKPVTSYKTPGEFAGDATEAMLNIALGIFPGGGQIGTRAGLKATELFAPKLLPQATKALSYGKNLLPRVAESIAIGEGFNLSTNLKEGRELGENTGAAVLLSGLLPVGGNAAGTFNKWTKELKTKGGYRTLDSLIKPLQKDLAYGKNPSAGAAGIVARDWEDFITKLSAKKDQAGLRIDEALSNPNVERQVIPNLRPVTSIFDEGIEVAASQNNQAAVTRLQKVKEAITRELSADENGVIQIGAKKKSLYLTPKEMTQIKRDIGELTAFTGNPSDDKLVNSYLRRAYGEAQGLVEEAAKKAGVDIGSLNQDYGNTLTALKASVYRDKIESRQNLLRLSTNVKLGLGGVASLVSGNPLPLIGVAAESAFERALGSVAGKTLLANWLITTDKAARESILRKVPVIRTIIEGVFGREFVADPIRTEVPEQIRLLLPEAKTIFAQATKEAGESKLLSQEEAAKLLKILPQEARPGQKLLGPGDGKKIINEGRAIAPTPPTTFEAPATKIGTINLKVSSPELQAAVNKTQAEIEKRIETFRKEAGMMASNERAGVRSRNVTDATGGVNFVSNDFSLKRAKGDMARRADGMKQGAEALLYENDPEFRSLVDFRDTHIDQAITDVSSIDDAMDIMDLLGKQVKEIQPEYKFLPTPYEKTVPGTSSTTGKVAQNAEKTVAKNADVAKIKRNQIPTHRHLE